MANGTTDKGGRRAGIERRQTSYTAFIPERREGDDRRSGMDRRNGLDRRSRRGFRRLIGMDRREYFRFDNTIFTQ